MRILHIVESFGHGAVENWLIDYLVSGDWTGFTFHFFALQHGEKEKEDLVERLTGLTVAQHSIGSLGFVAELKSAIHCFGADVVHSHHDVMTAWYYLAAPGKKWVWHWHNCDFHFPVSGFWKKWFLKLLVRVSVGMAARHVFISSVVEQACFQNKIGSNNSEVLHYGFSWVEKRMPSVSRVNPDEKLKCLFVGRLNEFKNPIFLINLFSEPEIAERCELDVYGEGAMSSQLHELVIENKLNHVQICGWSSDILRTMMRYDLFLFPRIAKQPEGLGIVLLEAQLAGIEVLSSPYIAPELVCEGSNVTLLPLNDQDWKHKLIEIAKRKCEGYPRLDVPDELLQRFSMHRCSMALANLYKSL